MKRPLEDTRILDLSHVWFGPYCTMLLAHLGAEVIKVEPPWGEMTRFFPPLIENESPTFISMNLNKKDLTLDLKHPKGKEIFLELVKLSDVVVENFTPGTMERLGLGYDVLRGVRPDIIYASLSGFGQTGPYAKRPSYFSIAEAITGHAYMAGLEEDEEGEPKGSPQAYGDLGPALFAALSIVSALRYRDKTGKGQWIDVAQADCMVSLASQAIVTYTAGGLTPLEARRRRRGLGQVSVGGFFKATDGYIAVLATRGSIMERLANALGVEEVNVEMFREWVKDKTVAEVVNILVKADVPVAPVLNVDEVVKEPHLLARGVFAEVEHPKLGRIKVPGFPVKFSEIGEFPIMPSPTLGQHTEEILINLLGYSREKIEELRGERVI
ncbi:MAG: CoA transferase [Candidatus Bathyarchaeia archaeon]|nr:CoA transferase [Candidatus Bathyarchaeota archaeon]